MIACRHARQIFDRYLDDELSPGLQAELHAHRINCLDCQGELALLEACGDVVAMDRCEPQLGASFTDRVLLARRAQNIRRQPRWGRRIAIVATPLAAAASIAFAWLVLLPQDQPVRTDSIVLGHDAVEVPDGVRTILEGRPSDAASADRAGRPDAPRMEASGLVNALLAPVVERAGDSIGTLRSGLSHAELLIQEGLTEAGQKLRPNSVGDTAPAAQPGWILPAFEPWTPFSSAPRPDTRTELLEAF